MSTDGKRTEARRGSRSSPGIFLGSETYVTYLPDGSHAGAHPVVTWVGQLGSPAGSLHGIQPGH